MKKYHVLVAFCFLLTGCASLPQYTPAPVMAGPGNPLPTLVTPSATPAPTQNAALMAEVTLLFSRATDTAIAGQKTEAAYIAIQQTQVAQTQTQAVIQTNDAQNTAVVGTFIATQTQAAQTAIATVTYGAMTEVISNTSTALAMTKAVEKDKVNAARVGVWGIVILSLCVGFLGVGFLYVKLYGQIKDIQARHLQDTKIEPDQNGRFPLVPTKSLGKGNMLANANLQHRAILDPEHDDLTTEQAIDNAQRQRGLEATRAISQSPTLMKRLLAPVKQPSAENEASMPNANVDIRQLGINYLTEGSVLTPAWSLVDSWDGKGGIPYGVSARGLEQVSLQEVPHGGVFGKTGSGKSRGFLRPFIAGAIAAGQRVVIIGKQADFWPFEQHPNVKMIGVRNLTEESEAARYADHLKHIVEEMNRRDAYLTAHHVSTWERAGRESTLIVLDELGNAVDMMPREIAQEVLRWAQGLAKEGRKAGLNIWLASQRAVGFKSIVEQLGRAVFYLSDADASRYALGFPGAENLRAGEFIAKFHHGANRCASFDPTDDELVNFLRGRDVKTHEPITWIDGKLIGEEEQKDKRANAPEGSEEDVDAKILRLYQAMKAGDRVSLSEIQRQVYGDINTGGAHFRHIQDVIGKNNESTTTTGNMPDTGFLGSSATSSAA